jgi:hypothetical protein
MIEYDPKFKLPSNLYMQLLKIMIFFLLASRAYLKRNKILTTPSHHILNHVLNKFLKKKGELRKIHTGGGGLFMTL